jgi:hypothetical protein
MPKIFLPVLREQITPAIERSSDVKKAAIAEALIQVEAAKKSLFNEFDNHSVTRELLTAKGESLSGAITGPPGANLFSYIGFRESPIPQLRNLIERLISVREKSARVVKQTRGLAVAVDVDIPVNTDLYEQTPFPEWSGGLSWLRGIETYISGIHNYLTRDSVARNQSRRIFDDSSRSKQAIQVPHELKRAAIFTPKSYITSILSNFKSKFRGEKGRFV